MKDIFILTGLSSTVRKDGDVDVRVHLTTQVSPSLAGFLLEKLTPHAHRFCVVKIEKQQSEINTDTGEIKE